MTSCHDLSKFYIINPRHFPQWFSWCWCCKLIIYIFFCSCALWLSCYEKIWQACVLWGIQAVHQWPLLLFHLPKELLSYLRSFLLWFCAILYTFSSDICISYIFPLLLFFSFVLCLSFLYFVKLSIQLSHLWPLLFLTYDRCIGHWQREFILSACLPFSFPSIFPRPEVVTDVHRIYCCGETQIFNPPSGH